LIFEYLKLTGMGDAAFSLDFISRVMFLVLAGVVVVLLGFKIKGVWGAVLALAAAVALFLYNEGMIRF
jgi:urea transporter